MRTYNFFKRSILVFLCFVGLLALSNHTAYAGEEKKASKAEGINVEFHTQQEIREFIKEHPVDLKAVPKYKGTPDVVYPNYDEGSLTDETLKGALNSVNVVRYIAGIPYDVQLKDSYTEKAQAGALICALHGELNHKPTKFAGMSDALYEKAYAGTSHSNLARTSWGEKSLEYYVIHSWMEDSDSTNIDLVGHRRWILNPTMKYTGFGYVYDNHDTYASYSAMYAHDNALKASSYYGVSWPGQNMPVEYWGNAYAWSISMGYYVDKSDVEITLTRLNDEEIWDFYEDTTDGYFNVDNGNYGQKGCIIFRPNRISYKAGDRFKVEISGLKEDVTYYVNFFALDDEGTECEHLYDDGTVSAKATTKKDGTISYVCTKCGHKKTESIPKASKITISSKSLVYNGKNQKPSVVVKDSKGKVIKTKNYKVSYKNLKNIGEGTVTVTLKGNYEGTKTFKVKIIPKKVTIKSLKSAKKGFTVTYSKGSKITGYQIEYSTDANFKSGKTQKVTVAKAGTVKTSVTKLSAKKTYYVRVRTFANVKIDGKTKKIYSDWSNAKKIKTK